MPSYDASIATVRSSCPSWGKSDSCSVAMVVFEQSTKPFPTLHRAVSSACWARGRKEQDIALALMIALLMVMVHIRVEHMLQGGFAEEDHPGQGFVFDRADPALRIGVQIR